MSADTFSLHLAHLKQSTCHNDDLNLTRELIIPASKKFHLPKSNNDSPALLVNHKSTASAFSIHPVHRRETFSLRNTEAGILGPCRRVRVHVIVVMMLRVWGTNR